MLLPHAGPAIRSTVQLPSTADYEGNEVMLKSRYALFATLLLTTASAALGQSVAAPAAGRVINEADRVVLTGARDRPRRPQPADEADDLAARAAARSQGAARSTARGAAGPGLGPLPPVAHPGGVWSAFRAPGRGRSGRLRLAYRSRLHRRRGSP